MLDLIKKEFPQAKDGIYLDTAATSLKPSCMVNKLASFYQNFCATVHRSLHKLSQEASQEYFETRSLIKTFIQASSDEEIVFTKNTTESINLVARSYGNFLNEGDEVVLTTMEHHSNLVPWQILAREKKLILKFIPANEKGELIVSEFEKLITPKVKIVALAHVSNVTGTCHPIKQIIEKAHVYDAKVLIDGAQAVGHMKVDVTDLDADFYCFSAHKVYGPFGVGVLYAKKSLLEQMNPVNGGGDMIQSVSLDSFTCQPTPMKFEPGTPAIAEVIAFHESIKLLQMVGIDNIAAHEDRLISRLLKNLSGIDGLSFIGESDTRKSIVTFTIDAIHPLDLATFLDFENISIRTGHLCAQPYLKTLNKTSVARASVGVYNTLEQVDIFADKVLSVTKKLAAH